MSDEYNYLVNHGKVPLEVDYMDGEQKETCMVNPGRAKIPGRIQEEHILTENPHLVWQAAVKKTKIEPVVDDAEETPVVESEDNAANNEASPDEGGRRGSRRN